MQWYPGHAELEKPTGATENTPPSPEVHGSTTHADVTTQLLSRLLGSHSLALHQHCLLQVRPAAKEALQPGHPGGCHCANGAEIMARASCVHAAVLLSCEVHCRVVQQPLEVPAGRATAQSHLGSPGGQDGVVHLAVEDELVRGRGGCCEAESRQEARLQLRLGACSMRCQHSRVHSLQGRSALQHT